MSNFIDVRKTKKSYTSPFPQSFGGGSKKSPEDLEREISTRNQLDALENTITWGIDNAFPLKLAETVAASPAASSCINTIAKFIKGDSFSNKDLMKLKINKQGQTLWDLHCAISDTLALFEGFSVNFKFGGNGKITNAYQLPIENCRFVKPEDDLATNITEIKYNPYFGTGMYKQEYTSVYPIYDPESLEKQIKASGTKFKGQVYYYGNVKPLYRFYPVPDYWSAKKWMYVDSKVQEAHAENLDNGFFSSVLLNMIGNPNADSQNPAFIQETKNPDGTKSRRSTKTVGQEFNEDMSGMFSGSKKMGAVMTLWSLKQELSPKITPFTSTTNADLFLALQDLTTKNITIATRTPGILANISEGVNLGSGGSEIQKAVEIMQSNTTEQRRRLEQFYNEIVLPNLEIKGYTYKKTDAVEIVNYNPITVPVTIDQLVWQTLSSSEKRKFIQKNFSSIELDELPEAPQVLDEEGNPAPDPIVNENLRNMTGRQLQAVQRIVRKFNTGELTYEQAAQLLKDGFSFTDDNVDIWLVTPEEAVAI